MTNLTNLLTNFVNSNTASTSGSGSLPSNTIANPKGDIKAITTRSGISSLPKVVERETEVTKDKMPPTNNGSTEDSLISNKEKLFELARTPLNEHCSVVLLKKLPEKLGDPGKFLIPCDFPGMYECLALADRGASINLMPLSVWKKISLSELTPTLGKFQFSADFVVGDFDADPRPFRNSRGDLLNRRTYSSNYDDNSVNRIEVIDMAYEEYSQEVLGFSDMIASGNPTPYYDMIISTSSPTLTPFGDSDFLLEEVDAFHALEDDVTSSEVDHSYYDLEGDILLLEAFLNDCSIITPSPKGMISFFTVILTYPSDVLEIPQG
ncbi:hypothetical protein Tco_1209274 [Tanacetum coccineum]